MTKKPTKSIWTVMLEYIVFAPVLATFFLCCAASPVMMINPLAGLMLIICVYITLALFHLLTQRTTLATYPPDFYPGAILVLLIPLLTLLAIFLLFTRVVLPQSEPSSEYYISFYYLIPFLVSYVVGPISGLMVILLIQMQRVSDTEEANPFQSFQSIWQIMLRFSLVVPLLVLPVHFVAFIVMERYSYAGLFVVCLIYMGLALIYIRRQRIAPQIYPTAYYLMAGGSLGALFLMSIGIFLHNAALAMLVYPDYSSAHHTPMMISSCVFGPTSGLLLFLLVEVLRVRRLERENPFESSPIE